MVKANPSWYSSYRRSIRIVPFLIFIVFLPQELIFADDILPPSFLTAISHQNGEVPLFWFNPHPDTSEIAFHGEEMLSGMYVVLPWRENCVGVRMSSPLVPFYLLKSEVYIPHQGAAIDSNYNFKAPFFVTVNQDSASLPRNCWLDFVSASASGEDSLSPGEWVSVKHDLLMKDSVFWIVFHWEEGSPLSPLVGQDNLPNSGSSFWGKRPFFHFEWHQTYHNLMLRSQIVTNSENPPDVDSFRVYRSCDPDSMMYLSNLIASVPAQRFQYTDPEVIEEQTYFYLVTSLTSEWQSKASNLVQATPKRKAVLETDKLEFTVYTISGQQIFDDLTLTNSGGLPLWFKIRMDMDEEDWMGGSDPYGYTWTDNDLQPESEFTWVDIESRGIKLGESGDDNEDYGFLPLVFPFPLYGSTFDSVKIASDGWLSFFNAFPCSTDTFPWWLNHPLPWLWGPYDLLAPFWDDLILVDSSSVFFYSNSDSAIISYLNMHHYGQADRGPYTFQTILTPDGEIAFQYRHIDDSLYCATVGIQNQDGIVGLEVFCSIGVPCYQNDLHDSLAIKIRPGWVKSDFMEGIIQPGENKTLSLTFDPLSYPRGIYHADLLIDSWDENHQLKTTEIPLAFCIDTTTFVDWTEETKPERVTLLQNYPNPFNPLTTVRFTIGGGEGKAVDSGLRTVDISLRIYNLLGQLVRTLVHQEISPGNHQIVWDGKDDKGKEVASGIYFCKLSTDSYQKTLKLVLLR